MNLPEVQSSTCVQLTVNGWISRFCRSMLPWHLSEVIRPTFGPEVASLTFPLLFSLRLLWSIFSSPKTQVSFDSCLQELLIMLHNLLAQQHPITLQKICWYHANLHLLKRKGWLNLWEYFCRRWPLWEERLVTLQVMNCDSWITERSALFYDSSLVTWCCMRSMRFLNRISALQVPFKFLFNNTIGSDEQNYPGWDL